LHRRKRKSKEVRFSKAFKGLPHSNWETTYDEKTLGYIPKKSSQITLGVSGKPTRMTDQEMYLYNPKIRKYKEKRLSGEIW